MTPRPSSGSIAARPQQTTLDRRQIPHEPDGYKAFAEFDASDLPPTPRAPAGISGFWWAFPRGNRNLTLENDPTAPVSPPHVLGTRYNQGMRGGVGPVNWGGWAKAEGEAADKSRVYLSLWLKIEGSDFENQSAGTKAGFLAVGRDHKGENEVFFWLDNGTGRQTIQSRFSVLVKLQGIPQQRGEITRNLRPNVSNRAVMTAGAWHQWEAVFELNDMEQANGKVRMWIDGQLVMQYNDVVFVTPRTPRGFHGFKWNPTWGGAGGVRTRQDEILIDHLYLSGIDDERPRP